VTLAWQIRIKQYAVAEKAAQYADEIIAYHAEVSKHLDRPGKWRCAKWHTHKHTRFAPTNCRWCARRGDPCGLFTKKYRFILLVWSKACCNETTKSLLAVNFSVCESIAYLAFSDDSAQ
jgi:hypothetical protein